MEVLREIQNAFQDDVSVDITMVSKENFFLFTPMLPEVSSGVIETRHILTPIRAFCKRARFYEANVDSIDLKNRKIVISHSIGNNEVMDRRSHILKCDYLVIALGSETNFFGLTDVANYALTIKNVGDALILRNHVINMLEQADVEYEDDDLRKKLMTFVIVGGGFSGVETAGELNDFLRDSIKHFYHNIEEKNDGRIILISSGTRLLPEVSEDLAEFALQELRKSGVQVILGSRVKGATPDYVTLEDGTKIYSDTLVWAGGVAPESLVSKLECKHDKGGKIVTDDYLEAVGYNRTYVLGDCASVTDPNTAQPYPPTAQIAIRQAKVVADNIISSIKGSNNKRSFDYKAKGIMAVIGKRNGVGILFGYKVHGFVAWWFWRFYYLSNVPTIEKKLRVMVDWFIDLFFHRDVTRLKIFSDERKLKTGDARI